MRDRKDPITKRPERVVVISGMRSSFALLFFLVTGVAFAQVWQQLPDFPGTARDDATSFVVNGKIHVGTGLEVGWGLTNDWYVYDPATDQWSSMASMPTTPRQYCTSFTVNDTGYVYGGLDPNGVSNELWAYYPQQDAWEQKATFPSEARYAAAAAEGWNYALMATGMLASGTPTNEAWKYHPTANAWEQITDVPGPARHRAATLLDAGGVLIIGGADSAFTALQDSWSYPIWFETGQWYPGVDLPQPRYGADASNGHVWVLSGGASDETTLHPETWRFTGTSWENLPPFAGGTRRGGVGAGVIGPQPWSNTFYYGLGLDSSFTRMKDWWRLDLVVGLTESSIDPPSIRDVPGSNVFTILLAAPTTASLRVTDMAGREVHAERFTGESTVSGASWSVGMYSVVVQVVDGSRATFRWIKN